MSSIKLSAQKVKDVSNLQTIAAAWRECVIERGWSLGCESIYGNCVTAFVERLAGRDKTDVSDIVLNDPYVYVSPGDKYPKVQSESIGYFDSGQKKIAWKECFTSVTNFMASNSYFISYCLICNLPAYVPLNTTPFAFTRGLREDGKWDEKAGLYGSKGSYVVFCDGHVTWFDGSKPAKFLHWNGQEYTSDIRKAVPNSAFITCGNEKTKRDYTSDGQLVILYHACTGGN